MELTIDKSVSDLDSKVKGNVKTISERCNGRLRYEVEEVVAQ